MTVQLNPLGFVKEAFEVDRAGKKVMQMGHRIWEPA